MSDKLINVFAVFGVVVALMLYGLVYAVIELIKDIINNMKHTYQFKHRFNVKPIAKCYCRDCKNRTL